MDKYNRAMNTMYFGAPPSQEVKATDAWDYLVTSDPQVPGHYYRGHGVRVHKQHITIRQDNYEWIPNVQAINELRALMKKWKARGWDAFVASVEIHDSDDEDDEESGYTYEVYESLGHSKTVSTYIKIPLSSVKFYKELPHDGLSRLITEPRRNGRLTGLSARSITIES